MSEDEIEQVHTKAEEKLGTPDGQVLIKEIRRDVFDEYDRAFLEGTISSREELELNKKHVDLVVVLAKKSIQVLRDNRIDVTQAQEDLIVIEALLHDAMKLVPERQELPDDDNREHSGKSSRVARLLMHGEDSALWSEQLLKDRGFETATIKKVKSDIRAHMGMPYVESVLNSTKQDTHERNTFPRYLRRSKDKSEYPEPNSLEGIVLRTSDFLTAGILAGADIDRDPAAGSLDKYLAINYAILVARNEPVTFEKIFNMSQDSISRNAKKLSESIQRRRDGKLKEVEGVLYIEMVFGLTQKIAHFSSAIGNGELVNREGEKTGDASALAGSNDRANGWNDLNVLKSDGETLDFEASMDKYYQAVKVFREQREIGGYPASDVLNW
ncbi:hypothetical protein IPM62_02070 [Candidatus Woesebacteria bacterium]|nr:MAG: hypothetical protein IPM62_02070 [Candidatus Woesebacteria bacterium]